MFRLKNGILTLPNVKFQVPGGSDVSLHGTYFKLEQEDLDLHGKLEMKAKLFVPDNDGSPNHCFLKLSILFSRKAVKARSCLSKITGPLPHLSYGLDRGHKNETDTTSR